MARNNKTQRHSAPGIYFSEEDLSYSAQSLGITKLGVVGETLKGPAFQVIPISNFNQFRSYFGGTSTETYKGSRYPKYELPYIAQSYLEQSNQLEVVRVLGLSGVNAGPAWIITASKYNTRSGYKYVPISGLPAGVEWVECKGTDPCNGITGDSLVDDGWISDPDNAPQYYRIPTGFIWHAKCQGSDTGCSAPDCEWYDAHKDGNLYNSSNLPATPKDADAVAILQVKCKYKGESSYDESRWWVLNSTTSTSSEPTWTNVSFDTLNYGDVIYLDKVTPYVYVEAVPEFYNYGVDSENAKRVAFKSSAAAVADTASVIGYDECENPDYEWYAYESIGVYSYYSKTYVYDAIYCPDCAEAKDYTTCPTCDGSEEGKNSKDMTCCFDKDSNTKRTVVAVIRSRGEHVPRSFVRKAVDGECNDVYENDGILYYAKCVSIEKSKTLSLNDECAPKYSASEVDFKVDSMNYGTFTLVVDTYDGMQKRYAVTLNKGDKNYIYNVIGGKPEDGDTEIYVEELYDVALEQLILDGEINAIDANVIYYPSVSILPSHKDVDDLVTISSYSLTKRHKGRRYLYDDAAKKLGVTVRYSSDNGKSWGEPVLGSVGGIYTVRTIINAETGKKEYFYTAMSADYMNSFVYYPIEESAVNVDNKTYWVACKEPGITNEPQTSFTSLTDANEAYAGTMSTAPLYIRVADCESDKMFYYVKAVGEKFTMDERLSVYDYCADIVNGVLTNAVNVVADDMMYIRSKTLVGGVEVDDVRPVMLDLNNYKERFRYASTPWILSEIKGSANNIDLHKLFRFHTISDGSAANTEVKISIENINPDNGTFDVVVRDFNDTDNGVIALERFRGCNLVVGDENYIALKIGSSDEKYETKSNYITVEVNEDELTEMSIPAGFMGYPVRYYEGFSIVPNQTIVPSKPYFRYNTTLDEDTRIRKQYFGISNIVGIDADVFAYKGSMAYNGIPAGLTPCFHLDSRIFNGEPVDANGTIIDSDGTEGQIVNIDGVTGYSWTTVNKNQTTDEGIEPRIGTYEVMQGTIYEDINTRKFTLCFYGGWDGWDYYRTSRSNSDEFSYNNYKMYVNNVTGYGKNFDLVKDFESLGFDNGKVITSDYYAYLAGVKMFDNTHQTDINVFATPGIDYVNQGSLVNECAEIIEDDRADCVYCVTTPDKPFGASDSIDDMYSAEDAVDNLEDSNLDSNYIFTYYPWYKYYDSSNNQYIYLPATRDAVRSIAYTDNVAFSWYGNAGWDRGTLSGIKPKRKLKTRDEDVLYDGRLNYIRSFANEGDRLWGDKNLQIANTQLNRLSTRRLLLRIKKLLQNACVGLLFNPLDAAMGKSLYSAIDSVLSNVKQNRGIVDYKIQIDNSTERIEKHEIGAKYFIKRTPLLEYIELTAVLTSQGVSFD